MPSLLVAGHLRQLLHTPAPAVEVIHVDAEKKAVPVILPAPVYNSRPGDVYELPAETSKPSMVSRCRPVFEGRGSVRPHLCTRLACTSKRSTRRRRPADNPKGVRYLLNNLSRQISREKMLKIQEPSINHFNFITPANTGFALCMYRQFMSSFCI